MDKIIETVIGVVVALVVSGGLFVGANKLFDLAPRRWSYFMAGLGAFAGLVTFGILWGNRLVESPALLTLVAIVIGGGTGYLLSLAEDPVQRLGIGVGGGAALGLIAGIFLRDGLLEIFDENGGLIDEIAPLLPEFDFVALVVWPLIGAAFGAALWAALFRGKPIARPVVFWATMGWIVGAWLVPDLGAGSRVEAIVGTVGIGAGLGAWVGLRGNATAEQKELISDKSRVYIFLGPALTFIAASLLLPLARTIFLSLNKVPINPEQSAEFVGLDNYIDIFTDNTIFNIDNWTNIFTSRLFFLGVILLAVGLLVGVNLGRRTGHRIAAGGGSTTPIAIGIFLLAFAVFSSLRGTIFNNLWWVFTVTILATTLGLAVAVLADRAKYESVAKSLIFMPMAISMVGAGIIWRFMYIPRDTSKDQTGVFNSIWVWLGEVSNDGLGTAIAVILLLALLGGLGYIGYKGHTSGSAGMLWGSIALAVPLLFLVYRFLGPGIGGFVKTEAGEIMPDTILFIQEAPYNNVWLMVVLIWMQVGFTMVIFSAAIKAVPAELLEAARVDGATESQSFWRITIPQIAPTIGVVVTTLIVLVMKVFDIVKVMTNGNFDTQVIANEMWQRAFTELNFGLGSALAVVLFIAVVPIMYINIRRIQKAEV